MNNYQIKDIDTAIMSFRGEYFFLSNFFEGKVFEYKGYKFQNSEAPFHAEKCISRIKEFELLRPSQSKKLGRQVQLRSDWEEVKDQIMYNICYEKFTQDGQLRSKLFNTLDKELIEGNTHNDKCWGMVFSQKTNSWIGENRLGIILMTLREDLRQ